MEDYSKVKLGLIGRFQVWRQRREAEKTREWNDSTNHEISEVDYSVADKLEADLLAQKRIKRATKDASKLYKQVYGKGNDGIGESDFIEDYLVQNGLKQKALPEPQISKRQNFIDKYPTEKSPEEIAFEKSKVEDEIYYRLGDKEYKLPIECLRFVSNLNMTENIDIPFENNGKGRYTILDGKMKPDQKVQMLTYFNNSLVQQLRIYFEYPEVGEETYNYVLRLPMKNRLVEKKVEKLAIEGKFDEAYDLLNSRIQKMAEFRDNNLEAEKGQEQQEERE